MKQIFLGLLVIVILLIFAFGTGFFTWSEFTNHLQTSEEIYWIILIFGTALLITSLGWFLRKSFK